MDREIINNIKALGIDMIDNAESGHPGIVLGAASIIYTLYAKHMNINVDDPNWLNRDRFVMSAGHGSALLYATLYMAGFNISLDDLKQFRRINSITPGHPEYRITPGVDMSTGPLGQGIASAVGMAIASKMLENKYIIPKKSKLGKDKKIFDYNVYALVGDGDLMEGVSYESLSLAGSLKLNNLIVLYDSNNISLDGSTDNIFSENIIERFKAMNFNTILIDNSISKIDKAISEAKKSDKPTLIQIKTIIGEDSINEGTNIVHGKPLDKDDIVRIKEKLNISLEPFYVSIESRNAFIEAIKKRSLEKHQEFKELSKDISFDELKIDLKDLNFENEELRNINSKVMNKIAEELPNFIGGSADLASSTKAYLNGYKDFNNDLSGRNIHFGVREHAMGAILNGLALSNFRPFGSTFLTFSDYLKPAIRMTALMNLPVTYIFTHDSINIGQDGPTHQPIEQLISLRSIPNFYTFRPADSKEIIKCWEYIINNKIPSSMVISRGKAEPFINNNVDISKGAYIVRKENNLFATIVATGSEVGVAVKIANYLYEKYEIDIRVVSMPCRELFSKQSEDYKSIILPKGYKNIVIEAGSKYGWEGFVYSDKYLITVDNFGYSGKEKEVLTKMNFSYEQILERVIKLLK